MQNVKDQNWFAVGLDLVIVVFGVWLAFQITEWSEQRNQRADTLEQVAALRIDLTENLDRLQSHLDYTEQAIHDLTVIRGELAANEAPSDLSRLRGMLGIAFAYNYFEPELAAYEALQDSGNLRLLSDTLLGSSVSEWQSAIGNMMRDQDNTIAVRNLLTATLIETDFSLASAIANEPRLGSTVLSSNFQNSFQELADNKVLDDALAVFAVVRRSNRLSIQECIEATESVRRQIDLFLNH
jgi:hypothetical protein